jgi:hypothetical protein
VDWVVMHSLEGKHRLAPPVDLVNCEHGKGTAERFSSIRNKSQSGFSRHTSNIYDQPIVAFMNPTIVRVVTTYSTFLAS